MPLRPVTTTDIPVLLHHTVPLSDEKVRGSRAICNGETVAGDESVGQVLVPEAQLALQTSYLLSHCILVHVAGRTLQARCVTCHGASSAGRMQAESSRINIQGGSAGVMLQARQLFPPSCQLSWAFCSSQQLTA